MTVLDLLPVSRMTAEELVFRLRDALGRRRLTGWQLGFAISIGRHAKRSSWTPTAKQLAAMRKVVADLRSPRPRFDGESSLIDDDDGCDDG